MFCKICVCKYIILNNIVAQIIKGGECSFSYSIDKGFGKKGWAEFENYQVIPARGKVWKLKFGLGNSLDLVNVLV